MTVTRTRKYGGRGPLTANDIDDAVEALAPALALERAETCGLMATPVNFAASVLRETRSLFRRPTTLSRCSRWGCLLPVGKDSQYGPGPVCIVCREDLRPTVPSEALRALRDALDALSAYADDHSSERPTDPTVVIPTLERAIVRLEMSGVEDPS